MRPGQLRHRITIERQQIVGRDPANQPIIDWGPLLKVWAAIQPISGREYWSAKQVQAETTHKIFTRWPGEVVKTTDRINFNDRILEIESIINVEERNQWLEIMCKEQLS